MAIPELITLPDCTSISEEPTEEDFLSFLPRPELVRALAEGGLEGARELLKREEAKGGLLARRIATFRERLRRQAARSISHLTKDYERKLSEMESVRTRSRKLLKDEVERLKTSLEKARVLSRDAMMADASLLEAVRSALLIPSDALRDSLRVKRTLWERIKEWFAKLWMAILGLFSPQRREAARERAKPKGRAMTLARLATMGRSLTPDMSGDLFQDLTATQMQALQESARKNLASQAREKERAEKREEEQFQRRKDELASEKEAAKRAREREEGARERQEVDHRLSSELKERGYLANKEGHLAVTYGLVEKFAGLVLEEEEKNLPIAMRMSLSGSASTGLYERGRLRQSVEVAHIDLAGSLLASRLRGSRHILEDESYVYREVRSESLHGVLLMDVSGSMAEGDKIMAAKKALLALYTAVRRRYPDSLIDIVAFDSEVRALDLVELWEVTPGSFTNTGEALHIAHQLLRSSRASRKELYLITDGLPESYTAPDRSVKSGNLQLAQAYALQRARELATVSPLVSTLVLMKSDNPAYERAARDIAQVLHGSVVVTDPRRLAFELLVRFAGQSVVEREMVSASELPPTGPKPSVAEMMARSGSARERRRARRQAQGTAQT